MISLAVMTIGAMAVIGMQTHVIRLNEVARNSTIARDIAQTWIERMKQDAATWVRVGFANTPGQPIVNDAAVLGGTSYLSTILTTAGDPQFQAIPAVSPTVPSDIFDASGVELDAGTAGEHTFCVGYRVAWVYFGRALRVDVRVVWPRASAASRSAYYTAFPSSCADQPALDDPAGTLRANVHTLYLSTVIRQTAATR